MRSVQTARNICRGIQSARAAQDAAADATSPQHGEKVQQAQGVLQGSDISRKPDDGLGPVAQASNYSTWEVDTGKFLKLALAMY